MTLPRTADAGTHVAHLRARIGGYVADMVILSAIAMLIVVLAGFILLATTDWAKKDPSDPQFYLFLSIIAVGAPLGWSALNIALLATRGQTGGQYVAGLKLLRDDGERLTPRNAAAWWFFGNPLLFSWPMATVAGLPLAAVFFLALNRYAFVAFLMIVALCALAPLIALVSALLDAQHRALHDRIAGVIAVPID